MSSSSRIALVTGATGYVGGRLVPRLIDAGFRVRVLVRSPERLRDVPWAADVEIVEGDLREPASLPRAFRGAELVYYLVHSMGGRGHFADAEETAARNAAAAARAAGLERIVYLGGLHPDTGKLSEHLESRKRVGEIFLASGIPTIALQAGVIIGSGSTSFEMIRHLTEVLPYMPAPRWVRNRIQPIAIRDVMHYLVHSADLPAGINRSFDIGGPDVLRYGQMMNGYALEAGLRQRPIASLPVMTPWLASQWVNLVTPIPRALAIPIIASLQFDCVAQESDIRELIPDPDGGLTGYRRAVRLALGRMREGQIETSWQNSAVRGAPADPLPSDPDWAGHVVYQDRRERTTAASPAQVWRVIEGVGGANGWYSFPLAWALRGWLDKLVGGVGLRRGRRDAATLHAGDALDFWRVETIERGRFLRLRAEMRVPGRAWLELGVAPAAAGPGEAGRAAAGPGQTGTSEAGTSEAGTSEAGTGAVYTQRAIFFPRGLGGRLYWYAILPFHGGIFNGMANRITAAAVRRTERPG